MFAVTHHWTAELGDNASKGRDIDLIPILDHNAPEGDLVVFTQDASLIGSLYIREHMLHA